VSAPCLSCPARSGGSVSLFDWVNLHPHEAKQALELICGTAILIALILHRD
jgi:hypothetical protein